MKQKIGSYVFIALGAVLIVIGAILVALKGMKEIPTAVIFVGATVFVSAILHTAFSKYLKKNSSIITSLLSAALSFVGALGLYCFLVFISISSFGESEMHPISYPLSSTGTVASFVIFICLIVLYGFERMKKPKFAALIFDVIMSVVYLPASFSVLAVVIDILKRILK